MVAAFKTDLSSFYRLRPASLLPSTQTDVDQDPTMFVLDWSLEEGVREIVEDTSSKGGSNTDSKQS